MALAKTTLTCAALVVLSGVAGQGHAVAADLGARPSASPAYVSPAFPSSRFEARLGVFAHDPWSPERDSGVDVNAEFLSPKLFSTGSPLWDLFVPRAHIGGTANFGGATSHAYVGLTWTYDITSQLFFETSFGGAVHNGKTGRIAYPDHNALGCSPLFRESASLGYRITPSWSVMATVEHLSNAGLCSNNRGLTNAGVRLGYSF